MSIRVQQIEENKSKICNDLLRALPGWFGIESAIQKYCQEVESLPMFIAVDDAEPMGFLTLKFHGEHTAEIHVMAVHPDYHRQGLGQTLVEAAETLLYQNGYEFLTVKTLSPSRENKEYEATRSFYESLGFRMVEEFKTLWGEANPCLLYIKAL